MLFAKRNCPAGVQKKKAEWIYCQAASKEHNNRGQKDHHPIRLERHCRDSDADEKKDHRIGEKRCEIPEPENKFLPPWTQEAFPAQQPEIGHYETGRDSSEDPRDMHILGNQE